MQISLKISLIIFSIFLIAVTVKLLQKGRIPEKYSLIWFCLALIILLVALVPKSLELISNLLGFEVLSNMVIGIIFVLLTIVSIVLSVMIAGQKKKTTLLIQEITILKKEIREKK